MEIYLKKKIEAGSAPAPTPGGDKKKKEGFFSKFLKNRLGKSSVKGEEIVGVELTLMKFVYHKFQIIKRTNGFLNVFLYTNLKEFQKGERF